MAVKDGRKPAFKECVTRLQTLKGCAWSMSVGYSRAPCAVSTPFGCREILVVDYLNYREGLAELITRISILA